jgi:hypothetical protein
MLGRLFGRSWNGKLQPWKEATIPSRPQRQTSAPTERLAGYRFAQTIVTRRVVELGLAPQRAPFVSGTNG